jgi:outer membrane protein
VFKNKKHAKIIAVTVVGFFLLSIVGIVVTQSVGTYAAPSSKIGKINYERVLAEHPGMATIRSQMEAEIEKAQKEFDERSKTMNDQQKQDYFEQVSERLALFERNLRVPLFDRVDAAIKAVAEARGLEVVFDSRNVYYGGTDVTDEVIRRLK